MKRYKESSRAEITVLLASFGVHRARTCLRRRGEGGQKGERCSSTLVLQFLHHHPRVDIIFGVSEGGGGQKERLSAIDLEYHDH